MNLNQKLEAALIRYKEKRIMMGDLLEDIVDDIHEIIEDVTNKWFDNDDIPSINHYLADGSHNNWCACSKCSGVE